MNKNLSKKAFIDILNGFYSHRIWLNLALLEFKQRYRRSVLGPFWITISTGVLVLGMGPIYGKIFNENLGVYYRYLGIGIITWTLISGFINEVCSIYIESEGLIKQVKLPYATYIAKLLFKHLILFAHNFIIVLLILAIFPPPNFWGMPIAILGVLLVMLNLAWMGFLLATICARFRDVPLIVSSGVQVLFFLTPVIWNVDSLGSKKYLIVFNPFYSLIEIIRAPLSGSELLAINWVVSIIFFLVGSIAAFFVYARCRSRISYWV